MKELNNFIETWHETDTRTKQAFTEIVQYLQSLNDVSFSFNERAGVSYSLRPKHNNQKDRTLFAMVDVIDDDPEQRWLSICFYGDMINDPDEMGDLIPGGLLGSDGYCFDLDEYDEQTVEYIKERLKEACEHAASASL